jgi:hypothetical protein
MLTKSHFILPTPSSISNCWPYVKNKQVYIEFSLVAPNPNTYLKYPSNTMRSLGILANTSSRLLPGVAGILLIFDQLFKRLLYQILSSDYTAVASIVNVAVLILNDVSSLS